MLILKNIKKDYQTSSEVVHALRGVDIAFRDHEFVSILGPSGCGKTTLLNIIGGLDRYTEGDLVINHRSTRAFEDRDWDVYRNHRVGFIFQSYNLIPHQTVLGNVELALTIAGIEKEERIARAKAALDKVGLRGQYYKRPNQLSGGQCQRVAIARALVNDPEILLADEPTGALDTATSVQIMNLIREIAGERLVIMVTHNPELAEEYSTRIIRLLDGEVLEDTDPVSEDEIAEDIEKEKERIALLEKEENEAVLAAVAAGKKEKAARRKLIRERKKKSEKAKMSFFTAFRLSARNLLSKKGRTSMVGIAGSIGIIGIAMVLAFSAGIMGYVESMQDDMLSGNPITITETTYDLNALAGMMSAAEKEEIIKQPNKAYINSLVEYIATTSKNVNSLIIKNDITKEYLDYLEAMPEEYYSAILKDYGMDMSGNIYTNIEAVRGENTENKTISISALTNMYTSVLSETDFKQYAGYITQIVPSFKQAPGNPDYIRSQYDVYGRIATEKNEIMLVLNGEQELSDLLLARLGYFTEEEFYNLIYKAAEDDRYDPSLDREYFDYSELLTENNPNKTFTWYPNDSIYEKNPNLGAEGFLGNLAKANPFAYRYDASDITNKDGALDLEVVGILIANESTTYGCLSSGIYYTEALTEEVLSKNASSDIVKYIKENGDIRGMAYTDPASGTVMNTGIYYTYDYRSYETNEVKEATAFVGKSLGLDDMMSAGGAGGSGSAGSAPGAGSQTGANMSAMASMKTASARFLGGESLANSISIYPVSFGSKDLVTNYLDDWNRNENNVDITYTDALELVINLITSMINVITSALVAFTSISLVVSTVMIGIITYVSVVERIKEIGVIRSLGGRKKDVSRLFTAETFIIGLLSGIFGIAVTYGVSAIASAIVYALIGIPNIALLPLDNAITLIILSIALTFISGVLPARSAAKKDPVVALRTE